MTEEEDYSLPEPPAEERSVTPPPSDDSVADSPSHGKTITGSGTTDSIMDPACVDQKTTGTGLEIVMEEDETSVGDDLPSQDDSEQSVEPGIPDGEIPIIVISVPSEVDSEDYAQRLNWEEEQEGSEDTLDSEFEDDFEPESEEPEDDDDSELEYAANYPVRPVTEVVSELPQSPVKAKSDCCHSPYHSPIIVTGILWSDTKVDDLGPIPFTEVSHVEEIDATEIAERPEATNTLEQTEAAAVAIEEGALKSVTVTSEDSSGMHFACFYLFPREVC